ncbi:unnamed protein product, partial [Cyprideis torosa]
METSNLFLLTGNFSCLIATFVFQRQNAFHLLQTYVPTILIVAISWVSFWLDPNAIPGRVTLGVTTLLTITTLASGVRANLPPVSYIKAIDIWIGICMMFVFGALLEFTLVNYLARSKQGFSWRSIQCWKQVGQNRTKDFKLNSRNGEANDDTIE